MTKPTAYATHRWATREGLPMRICIACGLRDPIEEAESHRRWDPHTGEFRGTPHELLSLAKGLGTRCPGPKRKTLWWRKILGGV